MSGRAIPISEVPLSDYEVICYFYGGIDPRTGKKLWPLTKDHPAHKTQSLLD